MKRLFATVFFGVSSSVFAAPSDESVAIQSFQTSEIVKTEIRRVCSTQARQQDLPIAIVIERGDVGSIPVPILVIQTLNCLRSDTNVAALVNVVTRITSEGAVKRASSPVIVDLKSLRKPAVE